MFSNKYLKKDKGFTLVEMLVSIAVFMIVMTVAVGSLVSIINANKKAQAIKNIINNINFAIESISKDMRMGTDYSCLTDSGVETTCLAYGNVGVKYKNAEGNYIRYRFVRSDDVGIGQGNIQRSDDDGTTWQSLTAPTVNVNITNMKFYVLGIGTKNLTYGAKKQPRVIITLEGTSGANNGSQTYFNMQTTVSQRAREI